jgi:predicted 3-demethylubiquinone-9 3-methyltransferase (glyoxalase superfamily)
MPGFTGDYPFGKKGDVLTLEFKVAGVSCTSLSGGPTFKHSEAFSFPIAAEDQSETDRYWNAVVGNGGQESAGGWCKHRCGVSWQITPRVLTEALAAGDDEAKRAFDAMMGMTKIDIAVIKAARLSFAAGRSVMAAVGTNIPQSQYMIRDCDGTRKIEWTPEGHLDTDERPYVTIWELDPATKRFKVTRQIFHRKLGDVQKGLETLG